MTSPTQRSLAECRRREWNAEVVERWNPYARIRRDLFGWCDIVALTGMQIIGIQACVTGDLSKRVAKICHERALPARRWLESGGVVLVWGWALRGARGKRKTYELKECVVTMDMLEEAGWSDDQKPGVSAKG